MNKIRVELKERSYDILAGIESLPRLSELIAELALDKKIVVVTDSVIKKLWGPKLGAVLKSAQFITVPRGEKYKTLKTAEKLYNQLINLGVHRDSLIIPFGGGVIGDLTSYVAATFMRGFDYIQVPTTLLAQVDSSIGGKTGVNHARGKNLIGVFYQPRLVFIDLQFLKTLPEKELKTGLAEVVKYGVIADRDLFIFLENNAHHLNTRALSDKDTCKAALNIWLRIVSESAQIKAKVVAADETEKGRRMVLNFGHTIGHALELLTRYQKYTHGEAVSIGMCAAARIALKLGLAADQLVFRIENLLQKLDLPLKAEEISNADILEALKVDKKVRNHKLQFVLPSEVGKIEIRNDVPLPAIKEALEEIGCG